MPSSGDIIVNGVNIAKFNQEERAVFRAKSFGMVYQIWYWVKSLVVWENVALPLLIAGEEEAVAKQKALDCLREVGMQDYANKRPMQLSGGEQQRVGLARALVNNPRIIIADEPTGNLDTHSADEMIQLLQFLNTKQKRTIIMVTHNLAYLPLATREIGVKDGLIVSRGSEVRELVKEELKGVL
jgi:putative ABC transport system ATP-binding protein